MAKLLEGLRVLELSIWGFVPSAAAILGDWGAQVIKVEHPEQGDPIRNITAYGFSPQDGDVGGGAMWEVLNRGKRSVGINIRSPDGMALIMELVDQADVFLTNFLPATCTRLGIDADQVRKRNPRIIYGRGTGYGPDGPEVNKGGFDGLVYWGRAGIATAARPVGTEMPIPLPCPAFGDIQSGAHLAHGVVAGLYRRERTGEGCVVDVSLLSSGLWAMQCAIAGAYTIKSDNIVQMDRSRPPNPLANAYLSKDRKPFNLGFLESDRYWPGLCEALGRPDLHADARYATAASRSDNSQALVEELQSIFAAFVYPDIKEILNSQDGPWSHIGMPGDAVGDVMAVANRFVQMVKYPNGNLLPMITPPARIAGEIPELTPAPAHADHTDAVLAELGRTSDEIMDLKIAGVVT